jgi:photosystem II stability/assembly factor-like uncharacterized protein
MFRKTLLFTAAGLLAIAPLGAQRQATDIGNAMAPVSPTPAWQQGLKFRLVGPARGGRVTTVTGVPSQPKTFYMGVASGGLFRTTDGGANWTPITDGKVPLGSTGSVAVADSDPNVIYLGTGSDDVRSNVSTGRGIYKTTDGGATWTFCEGTYSFGQIGGVRIHPTDPNTAWAAVQGDAFKNNADRGIYKTTDGGKTWKKTLFIADSVGAMDVELQPGNPNVVFAWMSHLQRKPLTIVSGGANDGAGLYKSTDGGEHFTKITGGLPTGLVGKGNIALTAADPNRVYALVEAQPGGGLYRSDDAGATWKAMPSPAQMIWRPFYYDTLAADPTNANVVYGGAETFYKSSDGGQTYQTMRTPHGDNHDMWINPKDGNVMIQSNDGGANISTDGGRTWSSQLNQPTAEIYGVWMDDQFPYKLYGAQQDDNTLIIPMNADPYNQAEWQRGPGCETGPIMPYPGKPSIVYGSCKGQFGVMDQATGQEKNYWVGAQSLYGNPASDLIYRFQRVSPMATSPFDPSIVYYGSQYLHRSRDYGVTWEKISPDLTAHDPCCQGVSGEPITRDVTGEEVYSTLYAISESPVEKGVIWTGSNDGPFSVTRDDGKTWTNVTPKDLPPGGRVQYIDASPFRKGSAYFAAYRYLLGDYQPYIYKTDDYGKTWTRLTDGKNGIPADWPTRVVREDPNRQGLLYAGTEFGLFMSLDNGGHWQPFQLNLPQVPVSDIKIHHKDLVLSTQGRSFWILDDISAIEQLPATMSSGGPAPGAAMPATLFRPRDGYRTRVSPNLLGPAFEYFLPAAPATVQIDVLDGKGVVVNSYSSNTAAPAAGGGRGRGGRGGGAAGGGAAQSRAGGAGANAGAEPPAQQPDPEAGGGGGGGGFGRGGGGVATRVTKDAGMNRVVWDLRDKNGLTLPPGAYQVKLTVDGASQTQPFNVLIDPRIAAEGVTPADLVEQYEHNVKMRDLVTEVTQTLARVRAARTSMKNGGDAAKLKQLDDIYDKIIPTPEGVRYAKPGIQEHITYLAGMTSNVDEKIGRDAIARYQELKTQMDAIKADVDRILGPGTR